MSAADWLDPDHVDEIQEAVRLLVRVLERHEDAARLVNLWLEAHNCRWRLLMTIGQRTRPGT